MKLAQTAISGLLYASLLLFTHLDKKTTGRCIGHPQKCKEQTQNVYIVQLQRLCNFKTVRALKKQALQKKPSKTQCFTVLYALLQNNIAKEKQNQQFS